MRHLSLPNDELTTLSMRSGCTKTTMTFIVSHKHTEAGTTHQAWFYFATSQCLIDPSLMRGRGDEWVVAKQKNADVICLINIFCIASTTSQKCADSDTALSFLESCTHGWLAVQCVSLLSERQVVSSHRSPRETQERGCIRLGKWQAPTWVMLVMHQVPLLPVPPLEHSPLSCKHIRKIQLSQVGLIPRSPSTPSVICDSTPFYL